MNEVTITAAPQAYITESLYQQWMETHTGTKEDFRQFLTIPSADRSLFLGSLACDVEIVQGLGTATYSFASW